MTDKKIIAVVGATGAQGGGLANAIAAEDIGRTAFGIFERGTELVGQTVNISTGVQR